MRKRFLCGHRGKGKYCHRCIQDAEGALRNEPPVVPARAGANPKALPARPAGATSVENQPSEIASKVPVRRRRAPREIDTHTRNATRQQLQRMSKADPVDLSPITHLAGLQAKARTILREILGGADYRIFRGKRLEMSQREIISVPVGPRYRLIFRVSPLAVVDFMSHEQYNSFLTTTSIRAARRKQTNGGDVNDGFPTVAPTK